MRESSVIGSIKSFEESGSKGSIGSALCVCRRPHHHRGLESIDPIETHWIG